MSDIGEDPCGTIVRTQKSHFVLHGERKTLCGREVMECRAVHRQRVRDQHDPWGELPSLTMREMNEVLIHSVECLCCRRTLYSKHKRWENGAGQIRKGPLADLITR